MTTAQATPPEGPLTWDQIHELTGGVDRREYREESVYDWCWVCGQRTGPDRLHVMIDNGHSLRHTYACRRHRYVVVVVGGHEVVQTRTDHEVESLGSAFRFGTLKPGWE